MSQPMLRTKGTANRKILHKESDEFQTMRFILEGTKQFNPTLRNVTIIKQLIFENKEFAKKAQLYKKLPTGMQYPTFNFILDVLEKENSIMFDKDGSFFWVGQASPKLQKSLEKAVEY